MENIDINKKPIEETRPIEETINKVKQEQGIIEMDNIIKELPIVNKPKRNKPKRNKPKGNKPKFSQIFSNKIVKYVSMIIIIGLIIGLFFLIPSSADCSCTAVENVTNVVCPTESISFESIKQQIITRGYAEITEGGLTIKLSPYIG